MFSIFEKYLEVCLLTDEFGHALRVACYVLLKLCREHEAVLKRKEEEKARASHHAATGGVV